MPHTITVTLGDDGRLFIEAPGAPRTRIVASADKRSDAVGQRVAELVREALRHEPVPMSVHDALEAWSEGRLSTERALALTGCLDVKELLGACDSSDVPRPADDWHARRAVLRARDAALDASRVIPVRDGPIDEAAIEAEAVAAVRSAREEAIALVRSAPDVPPEPGDELPGDPESVRWRIEDGTGSSNRAELLVRVLVGTERSTVIVSDPITGRAIEHDVVQHGGEAGAAAAAVYAALKRRDAKL